jgi:hypothetical protein
MSGSLFSMTSAPRCVASRYTYFFPPIPRPSRISLEMARATTSRLARSFMVGA